MGLGQTLLTIMSLTLLGLLFLTNNTNTLTQRKVIEQSEWEVMAASLATSTVERATGLAFDENTVSHDTTALSVLTPVNKLGKDNAEVDSVENTFDDFDDYNNFHRIVKGDSVNFRSADYKIWSTVDYVAISGTNIVTSASPTFHKRIKVYVTSPMLVDTIKYESVYSYWFFR
jgi:hypothetical protein